jgi:ubiquitin-protein ligase E3 C
MFAEEHAGAASRKRQQENRAKRKQLKEQQERRAAASKATGTTISAASPTNSAPPTPSPQLTSISTILPVATPVDLADSKPSAVAVALQQRQLRQESQQRDKSALVIQSFFRAHRSNGKLLEEQSKLLAQRLQDISTLRILLQKAKNSDYVPPPATATVLIQQILMLTRSIPYRRRCDNGAYVLFRNPKDLLRLQQVLLFVVMPGLVPNNGGDDDSLDPILPWLQSSLGMRRLDNFLRVCLVAAACNLVYPDQLTIIASFLGSALGTNTTSSARSSIVKCCRQMMLSTTPIVATLKTVAPVPLKERNLQPPLHAFVGAKLDLIQIFRSYLLFHIGGGDPIPVNAVKTRESCISAKERGKVDIMFQLVLDAVESSRILVERQKLRARFVSEILTVPLLTWKTSITCITKFVHRPSSQASEPFVLMLQAFVDTNSAALSAGKVSTVLPNADVPLTSCPATGTQCLLANLTLIGRVCTSINGSSSSMLDFGAASLYFHVIATLLDVVPLGTFVSRDSAVEWISDGKGQFTPIVLSPVITEQCKLLLVDSFVRDLFNRSIDSNTLNTEHVLQIKNDQDFSHEKDLYDAGSSATELAAKEARIDRAQGFWNSSNWARMISKGVTKMLSSSGADVPDHKRSDPSPGMLVNTSSVSRKLAHGDGGATKAVSARKQQTPGMSDNRDRYSPELLVALCRAYGTILARWGGGGKDDIVCRVGADDSTSGQRKKQDFQTDQATAMPDPCTLTLLNVLCFATPIVKTAWGIIQSDSKVAGDVNYLVSEGRNAVSVRALSIRPTYASKRNDGRMEQDGAVLLYVFVCVLCHALIITDDVEIHDMERPLPLHQVRRCIQLLKKLLSRVCSGDDAEVTERGSKSTYFGLAMIAACARAMRDLYDRSSRRPLCTPKLWLVEDLMEKEIRRCKSHDDFVRLLSSPVLRVCPFLVSFKRRLKLFERIVTTSRIEIQGMNDPNPFNANQLKPGIPVRIMRGRVLEDGLVTLNKLGPNLRQRIAVQYLNEAGARETGIDVGGLFKEFWTDLSALAFNPNYALFRVTEGAGNCLYPNPSSGAAHGSDHIVLFEFLGRILGKALYEGITIHPRFAHFFLSFLRGDYNFLHMLPDLSTLDPQLYNNLMFLKTYDGDAEELCLTFTVAVETFGGTTEIALIPNGGDMPVTNANKQRYIGEFVQFQVACC